MNNALVPEICLRLPNSVLVFLLPVLVLAERLAVEMSEMWGE